MIIKVKYRGVEQLAARRAHNPQVAGSSPAPATRNISIAYQTVVKIIST